MKEKKSAQLQKRDNYHFILAGFTSFSEALKILREKMPFYKIAPAGKKYIKEVFYDNEYNMLSDAGIVVSKSTTTKDTYFNIRRLSRVLNKRNKKYTIDKRCSETDHPRDYAEQIAAAINDSFSSSLTIDLEGIVKKTTEKIQVDINKSIYEIICGTGYRAQIIDEQVTYKDITTGRKVVQECVSLSAPVGEFEETAEILKIIERNIPGLVLYQQSRFEIAQKLLYSEEAEMPEEPNE